jgi:hypothetical protein
MHVVKVDEIGLKATQTVFYLPANVASRPASEVGGAGHFAANFGGQDEIVPATFEDLTQDLLRAPVAVNIGGINEVDAEIERRVDDRPSLVERVASAKVVRTQAGHRYAQA